MLDSWSLTESSVVCRQLGCGSVLNFYGSSSSSPEHSHECVTGFQCSGSEAHLGNCSSPQTLNCSSTQQLSITCLEFKEIRLTEGCEGNVEVFYNGSWGNLCYNQMDRDTCPSLPWGQNNCYDNEVASITCFEEESLQSLQSHLTCSASPYQRQCSKETLKNYDEATTYEHMVGAVNAEVLSLTSPPDMNMDYRFDRFVSVHYSCHNSISFSFSCSFSALNMSFSSTISSSSVSLRPSSASDCTGSCALTALSATAYTDSAEQSDEESEQFILIFDLVSADWFGGGSGEIWADVFNCDGNETKLSECSISSWSRAECSHRRDVGIICSDSSLALHDGLVRLSGERQCEGEVEVFIHQVWRRVLLDSWSLTESSVVCRQLGCGSVLNFYGSSSSSPEHSHECVTGFQCSGSEAHLGNCSSPQTLNCSSTQQLSITCLEFKEIRLTEGCEGNVEVFYNGSWGNLCYNQMDRDTASLICQDLNCGRSDLTDLSVFTTPATTTSASPPVSPTVRSTSVFPPQTSPAVSPQSSIPPVLVIVLVVVLLLLLVPLLILIQQNRVMRRALSKRRHRTTTEAVYEEIQHRPTNRHSLFTQRGSVVSTKRNSGYEDADELLSAKSAVEMKTDYYNDSTNIKGSTENYDDVVIVQQFCNDKADGVQEEYDDVKNISECMTDMFDSTLALHDGLVRLSGERQCEGEVEVFIHQVWRRVLLDSWSLTESSVGCRQLGCGSVLNFYGSSSSSPEHSHECVTGFQCSGSEAHLGNCSSPQTLNCSSTQQLSITCLGKKNNIWADSSVVTEQ
ncbi:scavenger receptor cysteine-rich type 1 M130-like protein [Labeo rohita]|uniref:Scavenger receptor cysteine-rich type 1 M130-like protein n=1 Tax=Labeo rohita TaxID=84645 RepID=A0A498NFA5_LABRO|nr:scavenger receptor cysteine-rich type 1 M130-like protein [Labeo rohita]